MSVFQFCWNCRFASRLIDLLVKWLPHACLRSDKWVCWTCLTSQAPHGCPRGQAVLSLTKIQSEQSTCFAQVGDQRPQAEWSCNLLRGRRTTSRRYQPQPHHEHHLDHLDLGGMVSRAKLPGSNAFPAAFVSHHNNHAGKCHSELFYNNHHNNQHHYHRPSS